MEKEKYCTCESPAPVQMGPNCTHFCEECKLNMYSMEKEKIKTGDPYLWFRKEYKDSPEDNHEGILLSNDDVKEIFNNYVALITNVFWEWPATFKLKLEYELYSFRIEGRQWSEENEALKPPSGSNSAQICKLTGLSACLLKVCECESKV